VLGAGREAPSAVEGDPRNRVIVADRGGQVMGTLQLTLIAGLSRHGMLRAQIEGVRVASGGRGQGLGRLMIEWAIGQARQAGCGLVQLASDKQRPGAIRFYESLGFIATHEGLKLPLLTNGRGRRCPSSRS
jgi:GNAT superfamily N-acetyltransferase